MIAVPYNLRDAVLPLGYRPSAGAGDCTFSERAANAAINFYGQVLTHTKGPLAGKPIDLEQWQKDFVGALFGWKRPDGTRRYRIAYQEIPRKAGKSTEAAGIALLGLFADMEGGPEVYSCAADREQSGIVFGIAKSMVENSRMLSKRAKIYRNAIVSLDPRTGIEIGSYKALSAEAYTKHGYNPSVVIFDELHAQPTRELWDVMRTGMGARTQPLIVALTTAGYDRQSICWEQHTYAERVAKGLVDDPSYLPCIYGADEKDDWTSPETWRKAQPNLGISVPESFYEGECARAKEIPAEENTFRRLYLNQWTEQATRWLSMELWNKAKAEPWPDLRGCRCWAGLDLASTEDLTALVLAFEKDGLIYWLPFIWMPEEQIHKRFRKGQTNYRLWAQQGHIQVSPGATLDDQLIRNKLLELRELYDIKEIACDPWNALSLMTRLTNDGFVPFKHQQGYASMSGPTKETQDLLLKGKLRHPGNPCLDWQAANVVVEPDSAHNLKPMKNKSADKIDAMVAGVMATGRALFGSMVAGSIYEQREIIVL